MNLGKVELSNSKWDFRTFFMLPNTRTWLGAVYSREREVLMVAYLNELERVSESLRQTLEQEARKPLADRKDEVAALLNSDRFVSDYNACIWWDGCYYCQDESNYWYCVKCCFF